VRETPAEREPGGPGDSSPDAAGGTGARPDAAAAGSRGVTEQGWPGRDSEQEPAGASEEGTREVSTSDDQGATAVQEPAAAPEQAAETGAVAESSGAATESGSGATGSGTTGPGTTGPGARRLPRSLTFQITRTTMLAVFVVAICTTPIAFAQPFPLLLPAYLIPAALAFALLRPRTVVDAERVRSRMLFREQAFGWDELASLKLDERRWLRAVLHSGQEVLLPAVRVRDLPHLALLSGGRVPDPSAASVASAEQAAESGAEAAERADTADAETTGDSGKAADSEPGSPAAARDSADDATSGAADADAGATGPDNESASGPDNDSASGSETGDSDGEQPPRA